MTDGSRDRSHLTLDLKDIKHREANHSTSGLSPISLPLSLLDSALLMSPEKILLATQQPLTQLVQPLPHQFQLQKLETPTPSNYFPKHVTRDQESFAEGFVEALQKLQGTTNNNNIHSNSSIPTLQNNSPSTVKFLLSLAALTPTLSPSSTTKPLLATSQNNSPQNCNNLLPPDSRQLEVPKIILNNGTLGLLTTTQNGSSSAGVGTGLSCNLPSESNELTKRYMDYQLSQLGQASTASHLGVFQSQNTSQFNAISAESTIEPKSNCAFIKKEPTMQSPNNNMIGAVVDSPSIVQVNGLSTPNGFSMQFSENNKLNSDHIAFSNGINACEQDMKKLERKRARNRLAASKCRQRKLQRIADLEQQVHEERERGVELQQEFNRLQSIIRELEEKLKAATHTENRQNNTL